jgi:long-chain acyl-CoA synthetase
MHAGHFLTRAAQRFPDRPAWLEGDAVVTFREAEARVNRLAHALRALGAAPGDRIGMLVPNCAQGLETLLAPMKAGMAVVPMNARLHPREHAYMLNDASYKKPQSVEFLPALPKNAYGKILERELRERYWTGRTRQV